MTGIASMIALLIQLYSFVILARVLMSWINVDPYSPVARLIFDLTEPLLAPVRNLMPPVSGMDFSPIIVMVMLQIFGRILIASFS